MSTNKKYWKSVEELKDDSSIVKRLQQNEFTEEIPTDEFLGNKDSLSNSSTTRRDFLKYVGFTTAAASLAACEGPVIKTIPYVVQPERIVPGVANYYATTIADGFDFSSVLVKTREARPIKVEKNYLSGENTGTNARVHASVLSLYDNKRLRRPQIKGQNVSWEEFDKQVSDKLQNPSGDVVLLTQTFASPSTTKLINEFSSKYGNVRHVVYDAISEDHVLDAYQAKYGERAIPNYNFAKAKMIVSVGADFLGDWHAGGYDVGYAHSRKPDEGKMSRHVQFESNLSITGAKADKRWRVKPSDQKKVLSALYGYIVGGGAANDLTPAMDDAVVKAASQLRKAGSSAVVVTGITDTDAQHMVLAINERLGSEVLDKENPRLTRQGNTKEVLQLVEDMKAGKVGALLIAGINPAYSLPNAAEFVDALKNVDFKLAFTMKKDETATLCDYIATTSHNLENWGDVQFTRKNFSLMQPTIRPLFDTRQIQECLLKWTENDMSYHDYIKQTWNDTLSGASWNEALHDGVFTGTSPVVASGPEGQPAAINDDHAAAANRFASKKDDGKGLELALYTKISMGDGRQANNPWLQEMPDPITRTTWDNYVTMSRTDAKAMGIENETVSNGALNGSYVSIKLDDVTLERVPVIIQPGQAPGSIGLALGYGKKVGVQKEMQTGVNAYPLYKNFNTFQKVSVSKASGEHEFACTQLQNTMAGRNDIIRETTLASYLNEKREEWNPIPEATYDHEEVPVSSNKADIWTSFDDSIGPHFNLSIDLNACTGCGACVIACHSENNVPVVGKGEVRRFRDMHWLRIDRYYSSEDTFDEERARLKILMRLKPIK